MNKDIQTLLPGYEPNDFQTDFWLRFCKAFPNLLVEATSDSFYLRLHVRSPEQTNSESEIAILVSDFGNEASEEIVVAFGGGHVNTRYFSENLAGLIYNLGIDLNEQGKTQEAIFAYREAIRLAPNYTRPYNNLALILESQGKTAEAISLYKKAVRINHNLWITQTNLGDALLRQGKLDEAIKHYREAIRSKPDTYMVNIFCTRAAIDPLCL